MKLNIRPCVRPSSPNETTNGVLGDLLPDLDQAITELLDSLRINLAELPAYSSHMRSGIVGDLEEPRSHCTSGYASPDHH
ncbi:hypothetical protein D4764_10G0008410 [Takifugu flavidus]|uniref:Uncharacterized protein n=1 Tax=Takifugu flavidus TaxID=433684 RepID=A0A5C6PLV1_9TELE|nr:hypothetical protein D4764_10G0008410 [Takifugu flavidus]